METNPYQSPEEQDPVANPVRLPAGQHEYLLTGRRTDGLKVTERVEAASADAAVESLRKRGFSEIVLHTDEVMALHPGQSSVAEVITPQEYVELRNIGGFWGGVWFMARRMYRSMRGTNLFLLGLIGIRRFMGVPWNLWDWLVAATLLFPLVFVLAIQVFSPTRRYTRFLHAVAWGQWDDVLRQIGGLEGRVPAYDLAAQKAKALAGLGRLDEALQVIHQVANDPQVPPWLFQSFLEDVYTRAHKTDEAIQAAEKAVELAPDNATVLLNLALDYLAHRRNVSRARQLIEQVRSHALSDLLVPMFQIAEGLLALEDGHFQKAKLHLDAAATGLAPFQNASPLIGAFQDNIHAYQAIVAVAIGDAVGAQRHFRAAEPRLRALRSVELLGRCQQALAKIGA
jgi:HAMP domain-containing protein